jgi:hypothetical protein
LSLQRTGDDLSFPVRQKIVQSMLERATATSAKMRARRGSTKSRVRKAFSFESPAFKITTKALIRQGKRNELVRLSNTIALQAKAGNMEFRHEALLWCVHKARAEKLQGGLASLGYRGASTSALLGNVAPAPRRNLSAFGKWNKFLFFKNTLG